MARGGTRPNAGRKKGSGTKRTRKTNQIAEKAAGEGALPLEVLLRRMREAEAADNAILACKLAHLAAPYCHPRHGILTVKGDGANPIPLTFIEVRRATGGGSDPP